MLRNKQLLNKKSSFEQHEITVLYGKAVIYIDQARANIQRTVDVEMVRAYWSIGKDIVEEEQKGESKAQYGVFLIKELLVQKL